MSYIRDEEADFGTHPEQPILAVDYLKEHLRDAHKVGVMEGRDMKRRYIARLVAGVLVVGIAAGFLIGWWLV